MTSLVAGDHLIAAVPTVIAPLALQVRASWAIALDLLNAIYNGQIGIRISPTVPAPPLLMTQGLIFGFYCGPETT